MAGPDFMTQYNMRSTGVKRLMKEAAELKDPTDLYYAQPLDDNLFEWHFTVRGPADTDFEGGIYHGRIILPADYPMKPPSVIMLTPNGRFQLNQKICLSISGHHPESWRPSWSIRTALLAIIGFMPSHAAGALGSLEYPPEERRRLAKLSRNWECKCCGVRMNNVLLEETPNGSDSAEARQLAAEISFKGEKEVNDSTKDAGVSENALTAVPQVVFESNEQRPALTMSLDANSNVAATRWELLAIWFLSALIAALVFRRFIFLENPWTA